MNSRHNQQSTRRSKQARSNEEWFRQQARLRNEEQAREREELRSRLAEEARQRAEWLEEQARLRNQEQARNREELRSRLAEEALERAERLQEKARRRARSREEAQTRRSESGRHESLSGVRGNNNFVIRGAFCDDSEDYSISGDYNIVRHGPIRDGPVSSGLVCNSFKGYPIVGNNNFVSIGNVGCEDDFIVQSFEDASVGYNQSMGSGKETTEFTSTNGDTVPGNWSTPDGTSEDPKWLQVHGSPEESKAEDTPSSSVDRSSSSCATEVATTAESSHTNERMSGSGNFENIERDTVLNATYGTNYQRPSVTDDKSGDGSGEEDGWEVL
ncbi:uncharacterized protein L201_002134 [Kwoniella dendrophila CBS 6074]|uniref:Uncharacterized protein n=1 Tax=Kwoniella dendrophila CBS 6074 TaxID=1295534 RepID=A0AAX4JQC4_9TREE